MTRLRKHPPIDSQPPWYTGEAKPAKITNHAMARSFEERRARAIRDAQSVLIGFEPDNAEAEAEAEARWLG